MATKARNRSKESRARPKSLDAYIVTTPGTCAGKPRIAGRRISVQNIAIWHERLGWTVEEIAGEFDLTLAEVYAALAYYFDHRKQIDQRIRDDEALAKEFRKNDPSVLKIDWSSVGMQHGADNSGLHRGRD